jgi:hypothetical protein
MAKFTDLFSRLRKRKVLERSLHSCHGFKKTDFQNIDLQQYLVNYNSSSLSLIPVYDITFRENLRENKITSLHS